MMVYKFGFEELFMFLFSCHVFANDCGGEDSNVANPSHKHHTFRYLFGRSFPLLLTHTSVASASENPIATRSTS
jgi:hypothetical protein